MNTATGMYRRTAVLTVALLLAAWLAATPGASAQSAQDEEAGGLGVQVNAPEELAGFLEAVQWGDTGPVEDQTADLVYAGTGCSSASYAPVLDEIQGNIALVDARESATNPADQCPTFTFFQKVQSAQQAGAIGFVQIPAEGEEPRTNVTAIDADIPALEVELDQVGGQLQYVTKARVARAGAFLAPCGHSSG
jgi:hypothetical protein